MIVRGGATGSEGQKRPPPVILPSPPRGRGVGGEGASVARHRDRAKDLRRNQTEAEVFVWAQLRSRRFSRFKFRRQMPLGNTSSILSASTAASSLNSMAGSTTRRNKRGTMVAATAGCALKDSKSFDSGTTTCFWNGRRWLSAFGIRCKIDRRDGRPPPHPRPLSPEGRGEKSKAVRARHQWLLPPGPEL